MGATSFEELSLRPIPEWFAELPLGIFVHWGAYAVPAWAEPVGPMGAVDWSTWFRHNPYSEWYMNTIRIDGSPAQEHHRDVYGDVPYDDLLDLWHAENFDAPALVGLFKEAGAGYVIPTTKHHDGIALWDAPRSDGRNTVERGPRRDLVREFAEATRAAGLRFGTYFSGGLDWHFRPTVALLTDQDVHVHHRPRDAEFGAFNAEQIRDLIDRYEPDILWNDINWPDEAKNFDPDGLGTIFNEFYERVPHGVVNDRFGVSHADYLTTEYEVTLGREDAGRPWENCRGLGYSFGYNQVEDERHYLSGRQAAMALVDVVSRGGHLLLNVGPRADGTLPPLQHQALEELGEWMREGNRTLLSGARPGSLADIEIPAQLWVRAIEKDGVRHLFVDLVDGEPGQDETTVTVNVAGEDRVVYLPRHRRGPARLTG